MKKILLPLAALAVIAISCDTNVKDSTATNTYGGYNLIENLHDLSEPALATEGYYTVKQNITRWTVDLEANEMIIDNQKYTFETDTMGIKPKNFGDNISYMGFSSTGNIGKGAKITDLSGYLAASYVLTSTNVLSPSYKFEKGVSGRLILDYTLNDQYHIKTFWPQACYVGQSYISEGSSSYSTEDTGYHVSIDFAKKIATVYALEFKVGTLSEDSAPGVILLEEIPVTMTHYGYHIEVSAPKTTVPGVVDNKSQFVATTRYNVTDFTLDLTSPDLTDVQITFKIDGKSVYFKGCSIVKTANNS